MNNRVPRRARAAVTGVITLFSVLAVPQLAQAAPRSAPAAGAAHHVEPSGTDASCPAASGAAASSATVTAPTRARAIGGSGSATVVWCPPASGAGSVVSYTVSGDGQQVTAAVPNDWAIIDGLTNGTSYTFTVTANTQSGAGSATTSTTRGGRRRRACGWMTCRR
jgi:large repetitive protein